MKLDFYRKNGADTMVHFDELFRKELKKRGLDPQATEDDLLEIYLQWLKTPCKDLGGPPERYFDKHTPAQLAEALLAYIRAGEKPPDPLLDRLARREADEALLNILTEPFDGSGRQKEQARLIAAQLLNEMASPLPAETYIRLVQTRAEDDPLADAAAEGLGLYASDECLFSALDEATPCGVECLLDILSARPSPALCERILLELAKTPERIAFFASLLARCGFEESLPVLKKAAVRAELGYLDYTAVRNAIEALGGTVREERDFSTDPDYTKLARKRVYRKRS